MREAEDVSHKKHHSCSLVQERDSYCPGSAVLRVDVCG